jgi:predicted DNA-binding transcriptional regulator YafY
MRADRIDLLRRLVRDRPGITAGELARELGVSVRSIFRDLGHLRDRGYPIEADRGRGGGIRLHSSWGLGRLLLSSEEALGVLLSLAISEKLGFPIFASDVARARRKIVDAFPPADRKRIGPLRERIFVAREASPAVRASYRVPDRGVSRHLQAAFVATTIVTADYEKADGTRVVRRLEPHALLISWPAWYLLSFDHTRNAARSFRFDRFRVVGLDPSAPFRARPREIASELLGASGLPLEAV